MTSEHRAVRIDLNRSLEMILRELEPLLAIVDRPCQEVRERQGVTATGGDLPRPYQAL
jgi:hypothetical protein